MAKKKDDIPQWVSEEIQNVKFGKPKAETRTGYILEVYEPDNKMDIQLYEPTEDNRHIITVDLPKKIKASELEKGAIYAFKFDQLKASLSKKVAEYLYTEKEIDMKAIYQFELKSLEAIDEDSSKE